MKTGKDADPLVVINHLLAFAAQERAERAAKEQEEQEEE